ncbi:hypothetical protein [Microbispora sp. H13382]|uniref:hypothetical protein n=1 Tax=Microbispora sp. H13382 TaxID=2729112 RepID=UPI0037C522CA
MVPVPVFFTVTVAPKPPGHWLVTAYVAVQALPALAEGEGDGDGLAEGLGDGDGDGDGLGEGEGEGDGDGLGLGLGEAEGDGDGLAEVPTFSAVQALTQASTAFQLIATSLTDQALMSSR